MFTLKEFSIKISNVIIHKLNKLNKFFVIHAEKRGEKSHNQLVNGKQIKMVCIQNSRNVSSS